MLAITLYLFRRGKPIMSTVIPMLFMLASTLIAMTSNLFDFLINRQWMLLTTGIIIFGLALWLLIEAIIAVAQFRRNPAYEDLEIRLGNSHPPDSNRIPTG